MINHIKTLSFLWIVALASCSTQDKTPLFDKDLTSRAERNNTLFAFVGEKINVHEIRDTTVLMDGVFKAKYKILQRIYGTYPKDVIEFTAYDHYGTPWFSEYRYVLLFVSEYKGQFYHEKYQFFEVYKTKNNKWASPFSKLLQGEASNPERINFSEDLYLITDTVNSQGELIHFDYGLPYFKVVGKKAYPLYGLYVEDLFKIKKEGTLKWRGLFGKGDENWGDSIIDVEMAPVVVDSF